MKFAVKPYLGTSLIKNFFLELFFPSFCLGCQKEGAFLCDDCKSTLEISEYDYCLCNKNPQRLIGEAGRSIVPGKCGRCQDKKLAGLYFALPYQEKFLTRKLIRQFKYPPRVKSLAKSLAEILIEHFVITGKNTDQIWEHSLLIPVPMETKKQKDRGYNKAEELAKELSKTLRLSLVSDNLVKTKKTRPQIELSAKERAENVKDAFGVKKPAQVTDKKIFLVDDVYTTGSTMEACGPGLKKHGAPPTRGR